ncbi:MAG: hypothetical protein OXF79_30730 [Chloroflexi bacterium]|nr:hypothetical protein [Chloroflexota bacterium]
MSAYYCNQNLAATARKGVWVTLPTLLRLLVCLSMVGCSVGSAGSSSTSSGADQERLSRTELEQEVPSRRVTDFLEKLPTEPWFFVVLGSLIAGFALRHWFLERTLVRSISEHSDEEKGSLSRLDWWVIGELRRRALRLRARANWILLLVFTLLLGGLYVVFFVLSQVLENERVQEERLEERLRNELFRARFGEELEALVLGVHWVALNEPTLGMAAESVREAATASVEPLSETLRTGGLWSSGSLSLDGSTGLVGDSAGRVFVTRNLGNEWLSVEPGLGLSERVVYAAWSTNGDVGLLVGDQGSVLTSGDRGSSWTLREVLGLGAPSASALSGDGSTGVVGDSAGRVFVTRDFGNEWLSVEPELGASERVVYAAWSTDGDVGLILGGEGSLLIAEGEPVEWRTAQAKLPPIATGGDGKIALARDSDDGVFISSDGGRDWRPLRFRLPGRLTGAAIDESGTVALVTNSVGAGYVSWNAGENWLPIGAPEGALDLSFLKSPDRIVATARTLSFRGFLPRASENHFVLQRHAGLDGWEMKSSNSVLRAMIQSPTLNDSDVHLSMRQFLQEYDDRASSVGSTEGSSRPSDRDEERVGLDGVFSDLRIIQTATLAILFFLVQTLSRLHRYSLRLAAFWESRSDSVLLAQGRSEMKFDDLVRALAPDTYDFKPSPQSPLRWPRRGS